ncbi:MAG: hypothetical protein QM773_00055 [Hyphomonadaceae bacterium]
MLTMKENRYLNFAIACGLFVAGFAAGIAFRGERNITSAAGLPKSATVNPQSVTANETHAADGRAGAKPDSMASESHGAEEVRAKFLAALEDPNSITRLQGVMNLFAALDATTWPAAYEAMTIETVQTGRVHDLEWRLMLQRGGEVAGADAMKLLKQKKEGQLARSLALTGWATANFSAARAWVEALPDGAERANYLGDLVDGAVMRDPSEAVTFLATLPDEKRAELADKLMEGTIQKGGFAAATNLLEEIRSSSGKDDHEYTAELFSTLADRMLRSSWLAKTPQNACAWIGAHGTEQDLQPDLLEHAAGDWARMDPEGAVGWVDSLTGRAAPEAMLNAVVGVVNQWGKGNPQVIGTWLNANSGHTQYDRVAWAFARNLMKTDPATAAQWRDTIKDQELAKSLEVDAFIGK